MRIPDRIAIHIQHLISWLKDDSCYAFNFICGSWDESDQFLEWQLAVDVIYLLMSGGVLHSPPSLTVQQDFDGYGFELSASYPFDFHGPSFGTWLCHDLYLTDAAMKLASNYDIDSADDSAALCVPFMDDLEGFMASNGARWGDMPLIPVSDSLGRSN